MKTSPFAITISRQLGSGGSYLGQRIAKQLGIYYIDREMVSEAAKKLQLLEEDLVNYDEKADSFWESFLTSEYLCTTTYYPPQLFINTSSHLFQAQSEIIEKIIKEKSSVIIGRAGFHILRDYPRHLSIFVHASIPFRRKRIEELYQLSEKEAQKKIEKYDSERARYIRAIADLDWKDACNYHMCIDTSIIGLENVEKIVLNYVMDKFQNNPA